MSRFSRKIGRGSDSSGEMEESEDPDKWEAFFRHGALLRLDSEEIRETVCELIAYSLDAMNPRGKQEFIFPPPVMGIDMSRADFTGLPKSPLHIYDADFTGSKLRYAKFPGTVFHNVNFSGTDLTGADMRNANLLDRVILSRETIFDKVRLRGAKVNPEVFRAARVDVTGIEKHDLPDGLLKLWEEQRAFKIRDPNGFHAQFGARMRASPAHK